EIGYLKAMSQTHGYQLVCVNAEVIESMSHGNTHGGIIALCGDRDFTDCTSLNNQGFWVRLR
ncbi:MAG: hypothetical protein J6U74_00445, partial [Clostridia bacterium]|nr:hypothetical protein [Clostridia bacterium]